MNFKKLLAGLTVTAMVAVSLTSAIAMEKNQSVPATMTTPAISAEMMEIDGEKIDGNQQIKLVKIDEIIPATATTQAFEVDLTKLDIKDGKPVGEEIEAIMAEITEPTELPEGAVKMSKIIVVE